jgi:hypothetical protein
MTADLQTALSTVLVALLGLLGIAIGTYGPKLLRLVLAYVEARLEAVLQNTKLVSQEQAHYWAEQLCQIADARADKLALADGEARAQWVYDQLSKLGLPLTREQVQLAYNKYKAQWAAGQASAIASGDAQ